MVITWIVVGAFVWLAAGWLPSRMIKYYFVTRFGPGLGNDAYTKEDEIGDVILALLGPCVIIGAFFFLYFEGGKKGWKW